MGWIKYLWEEFRSIFTGPERKCIESLRSMEQYLRGIEERLTSEGCNAGNGILADMDELLRRRALDRAQQEQIERLLDVVSCDDGAGTVADLQKLVKKYEQAREDRARLMAEIVMITDMFAPPAGTLVGIGADKPVVGQPLYWSEGQITTKFNLPEAVKKMLADRQMVFDALNDADGGRDGTAWDRIKSLDIVRVALQRELDASPFNANVINMASHMMDEAGWPKLQSFLNRVQFLCKEWKETKEHLAALWLDHERTIKEKRETIEGLKGEMLQIHTELEVRRRNRICPRCREAKKEMAEYKRENLRLVRSHEKKSKKTKAKKRKS